MVPRLDVRTLVAVGTLLAEAEARVEHEVVLHDEVLHAAPIALLRREEVLDGVVALLEDVVCVADVLLVVALRAGLLRDVELLRDARVVDLPGVAVRHRVVLAAAVDLHGVAEARGIVAPEDPLRLNRAADPAELAVRDGEVAARARADAVDAHVLDGDVVDRHAVRAADRETVALHVELDRAEAFAGVLRAVEVDLPRALLVVVVPEVEVPVEVAVGVEGPPRELVEARARLLVRADHDLRRVLRAAVEDERPDVAPADVVGPHVRVLGARPLRGIGAVLGRAVDAGLGARAVGRVGDAGGHLHRAAVDTAALEEHVGAGGELLPREARRRPPRGRGRTPVGVVAARPFREEVRRRAVGNGAVRRRADLRDARGGLGTQFVQRPLRGAGGGVRFRTRSGGRPGGHRADKGE